MRQKGMARSIGLVLVALVVVGFGLFIATRPTVPWPEESRRVVHPAGFSIVAPPEWEHFLVFADVRQADALRILPKKAVGNNSTISLTKVKDPVTPDGLAKKNYDSITFQGQPAYTLTYENKYAREHSRSVLFQRNGVWYDVMVRRPLVEPIDTGVWLAYAESFRVEPQLTPSTPTTVPTTNLAVTP